MLADLPAKRACHQTPPSNTNIPQSSASTTSPTSKTQSTPKSKAHGSRKFVSTTNPTSLVRSGGRKQILIKQSAGGKATRRFVATASTTVASIAKNMQMRKQKQHQQQSANKLKVSKSPTPDLLVDANTNDAGRSTRSTPLKDHPETIDKKPVANKSTILFKSIRRKTQRVVSKIADSLRNKKSTTVISNQDSENAPSEEIEASVENGVSEMDPLEEKKEASSKKGFFRKTMSFRKSKRLVEPVVIEAATDGGKMVAGQKLKPESSSIVIDKKTRAAKTVEEKESRVVEVPNVQIVSESAPIIAVPQISVTESLTVVTASLHEVSSTPSTLQSPLAPILVSPSPSASSISQTPSPGVKRRPRKLNDCIAMLTGKLTEKLGIPFLESDPIIVPKPVSPMVLNVPSIPTVHAFLTGQELPTPKPITRTTLTIPSYPVPTPTISQHIPSDTDDTMILDLSIPKVNRKETTPPKQQQLAPLAVLIPSPTQKRRTPRKPRNQRSNSIASYQELIIPTPPSSKQIIPPLTPNPLSPPVRDTISEIIFAVSRGEDTVETVNPQPTPPSPPPYVAPFLPVASPLDTCVANLPPLFQIPVDLELLPSPAAPPILRNTSTTPTILLDKQNTPSVLLDTLSTPTQLLDVPGTPTQLLDTPNTQPPTNESFGSSRIKLKPMSELLAPAPPPVKNTRSRRLAKNVPKFDVELLNRSDEDTSLVVSTPCVGDEDNEIPIENLMVPEAFETAYIPSACIDVNPVSATDPVPIITEVVLETPDITKQTRTTRRVARSSESSANVPIEQTPLESMDSVSQSITVDIPKVNTKSGKKNKTSANTTNSSEETIVPDVSLTVTCTEPIVDNAPDSTPTEHLNKKQKKISNKKGKATVLTLTEDSLSESSFATEKPLDNEADTILTEPLSQAKRKGSNKKGKITAPTIAEDSALLPVSEKPTDTASLNITAYTIPENPLSQAKKKLTNKRGQTNVLTSTDETPSIVDSTDVIPTEPENATKKKLSNNKNKLITPVLTNESMENTSIIIPEEPKNVTKQKVNNKRNKTTAASLLDKSSVSEISTSTDPQIKNADPEPLNQTKIIKTTFSPRSKRGNVGESTTIEPIPLAVNDLVAKVDAHSPRFRNAKLMIIDCMKDGQKAQIESTKEVVTDAIKMSSQKQAPKNKAKRDTKESEEESGKESRRTSTDEGAVLIGDETASKSPVVKVTPKKNVTKRAAKRSLRKTIPENNEVSTDKNDSTGNEIENPLIADEESMSKVDDRPKSTNSVVKSAKPSDDKSTPNIAETQPIIPSEQSNLVGKQKSDHDIVESNINETTSKEEAISSTRLNADDGCEPTKKTVDSSVENTSSKDGLDSTEHIQTSVNVEPTSASKTLAQKNKSSPKLKITPAKLSKYAKKKVELDQVFDALKEGSSTFLEEKKVQDPQKSAPIAEKRGKSSLEETTTNPFESDDDQFHPWDPEIGLMISTEILQTDGSKNVTPIDSSIQEPAPLSTSTKFSTVEPIAHIPESIPPRETSSPTLVPKQQRKRRKNELAQIIADQLLESFKQVDQSRIGELKMLHDITIDSSSDDNLLRTTMSYTPPPKRKSASKMSEDLAAANASAASSAAPSTEQKGFESDASTTGRKKGKSSLPAVAKSIKSILSLDYKTGKADKKKRGGIRFNLDPEKDGGGHQSDTEVVQPILKGAGRIMSRRQTICVERLIEEAKTPAIVDIPTPKAPKPAPPLQNIEIAKIPKKIRTSRRSIDIDFTQRFKRSHKAKPTYDGKSKKSTVSNDMVAQIINDFTTSTIDSRNNSPLVFGDQPVVRPTTSTSLLNGTMDKPKNRTLELLRNTDKQLNIIKSPLRAPFMSPRWEADAATPSAVESENHLSSWHTLPAAASVDEPEKSVLKSLKNKTKSLLGISKSKKSKKAALPKPSAVDVVKRPLLRPSILNGTLNGGPQSKAKDNGILLNLEKNDLFIEKDLGFANNETVADIFAVSKVPVAGNALGFDAVKASPVTVRGAEVANTIAVLSTDKVETSVQLHILKDLSKKIKPTGKMASIKKRPVRNATPAPPVDNSNTTHMSNTTLPAVPRPLSVVDQELLHFDCSQDTVLSAIVNRICTDQRVESEDEDLCLSQIANTLNSKLLTTDEFNNDETPPEPATIFKVPSDLDAIRPEGDPILPSPLDLPAVPNDSMDMDENTNTDLVDMDLEDSMSVYTSFSMDTNVTASGGRKKKRRGRKSIISKSSRKAKRTEDQFLSPTSFHCTICDKPFSSQAGLTSHKSTLKHISKLSEQEFLQSKESLQPEPEPEPELNLIDTPDANAELPCGSETRTSPALPSRPPSEHIPEPPKPASLPSRCTPTILTSPVRHPPPPISNTYRPSGIEPISSPEQPDHTSDRYTINSRLALPMLGSPRQVLSQEERLFYECCSMLKGSERRVSDSPPTYYQLPRIHSSEMIMANNKPVTPRSNEQYSYVVPEGSKGKGTPKIDLNQFSDISSDSNPAYSCPQIPSSSADTQHIFARQPKTSGLLFNNAYSSYGTQRDTNNHSTYPSNTSAAMENIASAKSHVPSTKHPDIGDSFQSSQDAIENVEHFGRLDGSSGAAAANSGVSGASTFERILERDSRKEAAPIVVGSASLVSSELPPGLCESRLVNLHIDVICT